MKKFFYSYSERLHRALMDHGFRPVCTGIHNKTGAQYWQYPATQALNDYKNNVYPEDRDNY